MVETETIHKPTAGRIFTYILFAWVFGGICILSAAFTVSVFVDFTVELTLLAILANIFIIFVRYGPGAYVLGTLTGERINKFATTAIYCGPNIILNIFVFVSSFISNIMGFESIFDSIYQQLVAAINLILGPFISYYFLSLGATHADNYARPRSVLNIPWQQWFWILPFALFQTVGVPLFLLFSLWYVDIFVTPLDFNLFHLASFIPRIIVFALLFGVLAAISAAYDSIKNDYETVGLRVAKVFGVWLLLSIIQVVILLGVIAQHLD